MFRPAGFTYETGVCSSVLAAHRAATPQPVDFCTSQSRFDGAPPHLARVAISLGDASASPFFCLRPSVLIPGNTTQSARDSFAHSAEEMLPDS